MTAGLNKSSLFKSGFNWWPVALVGLFLIKASLSLFHGSSTISVTFGVALYSILLLLGTVFAIRNSVDDANGGRLFWAFMACGYGLWALDQWVYVYYAVALHRDVPDSSIADPALFLHVVPFMAAMVIQPHLKRSNRGFSRVSLNFFLMLFFWVFLYTYLVFPHQYLWNSDKYGVRFDILYSIENITLVVAVGLAAARATGKWRTIYLHLFAASALYALTSTLANFAIDTGRQYNGSVYSLAQTATLCWFVWVPLRARQLGRVDVKPGPSNVDDTAYMSLLAMLAAVSICLIGIWELFLHKDHADIHTFRFLVVLVSIVLLATGAFLKEYLIKRDLAADVRVSHLQNKLSEAALSATEALKGSILSSLDNLIAVIDKDGIIIDVNSAWLLGVSQVGLPSCSAELGANYLDILRHSVDRCPEAREVLAVIETVMSGSVPRLRYDYRCASTSQPRWFALTVTPLRGRDGGVVISYKDVSDVKILEIRHGEILESVNAIFWRAEAPTFHTTFTSKQVEKILGYSRDKWLTEKGFWKDHIHPEDRELVIALTAKATQEGRRHEFEYRMIAANGETIWLRNIVNVIVENNEPRELVGVAVDITERKKTEEALKDTEDRYRDLVEHSRDLMCTHDLKGRLLSVNPAVARSLGYEVEELLEMSIPDLLTDRDRPQFDGYRRKIQEDGVATGLMRLITRAGEERIWEYENTLRTEGVSNPIVRGIARDVTDRRRVQAALKKSEEKFARAFRESPMGLTLSSARDHRYLEVNETFEKITGYRAQELIGRSALEIGLWVDSSQRVRLLENLLKGGSVRNLEYRICAKNGTIVTGLVSADLIQVDGEPCILAATADITELKRMEQELHESENQLAGVVGSAMDAIVAVDEQQGVVLFNAAAEKMFGCTAQDAVGGSIDRFIPLRFRAEHHGHIGNFGESGVSNRIMGELGTLWALRANGEEFPIEASISRAESKGKNLFTVIIRDVTERRQAEESLRKSEQRFRLAAQTGKMYAYEWDAATDMVVRSEEYVNVLGLKDQPRAWRRPELVTSVHPDDRDKFAASVERLTPENPATLVTYRVLRPDGSLVWLEKNARAFFDDQGRKVRMIGMVADITERKHAEEALRDSEEQYRRVVDHLHDALIIDDAAGHVIFANDRFLQMFGIHRAELSAIRLEDHVAPEWLDQVREGHDRRIRGEDVPFHFEYQGIRRDGQRIWLEANVVPIQDGTGRVTHTQSVIRDISQRKLADEALASVSRRMIEAQEQERTRIARELHDDVNQRIALLAIELDQLKQHVSDSTLDHRIQQLCEQLFELGKDVQVLSHRLHSSKLEYLGLAAAARSFCEELSEQQNVDIEFDHAGLAADLSGDISLCLFRILQEALHNAVKHSGVKRFKVDLQQIGDTVQLIVSDTGMGFDPEAAMAQHGLGLVSMRERVSLVGGTIAIKSSPNHGAIVQVRIPTAKMNVATTTPQVA